jgi:hypothetical protein
MESNKRMTYIIIYVLEDEWGFRDCNTIDVALDNFKYLVNERKSRKSPFVIMFKAKEIMRHEGDKNDRV